MILLHQDRGKRPNQMLHQVCNRSLLALRPLLRRLGEHNGVAGHFWWKDQQWDMAVVLCCLHGTPHQSLSHNVTSFIHHQGLDNIIICTSAFFHLQLCSSRLLHSFRLAQSTISSSISISMHDASQQIHLTTRSIDRRVQSSDKS